MGLIFSLFDVASTREVPFGIPQYVEWDLPVSSFVFDSSLLIVKSVNLVVAREWLPLRNEKSSLFFIVATFNTEVLFKHFLIRTTV